MAKEQAYQEVSRLVTQFAAQLSDYKKSTYNETQTRRDFIDPFFEALGWDVDNSAGKPEAYREVIHEDRVKVGKATKAPDYAFRLSGQKRLFFVEAKKPGISIKTDPEPAYQVRRYGWSAKLPVSIVTDFEEMGVYDCTRKPNLTDKASVACIRYLTFDKYLQEFDFLWDTFAKSSVSSGSLQQLVKSKTAQKGSSTVDKEFLQSLNNWRTYLATSISLNNQQLTEEELNFAVQQTLDRIIFLRICEDRGIELYGTLNTLTKKGVYYQNLFGYFRQADDKYNSGLFDLANDPLSKHLTIDNKVIKTIVQELYYPESPYAFSVIPVEILGNAYEQFLGKQIKIDEAHRVSIEDKPEVRKAGGVYYTPQYIVEYIVQQTVGKLVAGKTPDEISRLKIADPACGSGSFLLGAYRYLLDWHLQYYLAHSETAAVAPAKPTKGKTTKTRSQPVRTVLTPDGKLTTAEKKRILLNNLYGVDIDVQAVEVTKLSLLLKCLEGETEASINQQLGIFSDRILPTLDDNIKNGNSLIDMDFYDGQFDFEPAVEKKVKPFNWKNAFPEVFVANIGGFDIVIGNPPYVRQELIGDLKKYFQKKFQVYHGMADLYSYFFERGMQLLKRGGLFGIIVANKWMRANYGEPLRRWLKQQDLKQIIDFGDLQVFDNATTYPCIIVAGKDNYSVNRSLFITNVHTLEFDNLDVYVTNYQQKLDQQKLDNTGWQLAGDAEQLLFLKIQTDTIPLGEYVKGKIFRGVLSGLDEAFVIDSSKYTELIREDAKSVELLKPYQAGKDIKRYQVSNSQRYLVFIPKGFTKKNLDTDSENPWEWFAKKYPAIAKHLRAFEEKAKIRYDKGDYWWEMRACEYYQAFEKPKITFLKFQVKPVFTFDNAGFIVNSAGFIIPVEDKVLLGILNSKLGWYNVSKICTQIQNGYQLIWDYFKNFPIKTLNLQSKSEKLLHDEMVKQVDTMLQLQHERRAAQLPAAAERLQQRIAYVDDCINQLVYRLYDLTEEEIRLVEG